MSEESLSKELKCGRVERRDERLSSFATLRSEYFTKLKQSGLEADQGV